MSQTPSDLHIPLVSVLLPAYNCEAYVLEAVSSMLSQSFSDFELLVIDDGSTDSTRKLLEAVHDARLRLVSNERNIGLIGTLNRGLALAVGRYIARMDADDISAPERLEKQVQYLEANPDIHVLGSMVNLIDEQGNVFGAFAGYPKNADEIHRYLLRECCLIHPSVMFRKDTVLAADGYSTSARHAEDYDLWLRLSDHHKIANLPDKLVSYRMHRNQVSIRNLTTQHHVAQSCRIAALKRRSTLGEDVSDVEQVMHAGLWRRLSAAECTLGWSYLSWARIYRWMKQSDMALRLAFKAVLRSPFSGAAWGTLIICTFEAIVPSSLRQAVKWYAQRLSKFLWSGGRFS
ncbi:MAG: glycosyltransferase [Gallionella sp.]|nr:glycosyltransferase [Gallionella sp.]